VWIGVGSIILPGVVIEDYAVIAGGSVVAHNVPIGAIVGGNPARVNKYRDESTYLI
jgi:maltose O-acetyltransferase